MKIENPNFTSNIITLHIILLDRSGSMDGEKEKSVRKGLNLIQEELMKLEDTSSTRVAVVEFGDNVYPSDLSLVETFYVDYRARSECTALYDAICYVKRQIANLYSNYRDKYRLNINVIVLSDGSDNQSFANEEEAKEAVRELRSKYKTSTIFYAIEEEDYMEDVTRIARELGFDVKRIDGNEASIENMSRQLSTMLVSSSRSGVPAELSGLSATLGSTVSKVAAEKFKESLAEVEEIVVDPFADLV